MKTKHLIVGLMVLVAGIVIIALVGTDYSRNGKYGFKPIFKSTPTQPKAKDDGGVEQEEIPFLEDLLKISDKDGVSGSSLPVSYSEIAQVEELRKRFQETFKENLVFIKDDIITKGSQKFWLVTFEPSKESSLVFKYSYETLQAKYERRYEFDIGEKGEPRTYHHGEYGGYVPYVCLGDYISLPVPVGEHMKNYTFAQQPLWDNRFVLTPLDKNNVTSDDDKTNIILTEPGLVYLGQITKSGRLGDFPRLDALRNPKFFWIAYAVFEAKTPTEFNLRISPEIDSHLKDSDVPSVEIPVRVVPKEESITTWPRWASVWKYPASDEDEYTDEYYETPVILRVGDLMKITYYSAEYPLDFDKELLKDIRPNVEILPFSTENYNRIQRVENK